MQTIHNFIFKEDITSQLLYMRVFGLGSASVTEDELSICNCSVDFNTFFNAFEIQQWKELTDVKDFFLDIFFLGKGFLEISYNYKNKSTKQIFFLDSVNYKKKTFELLDLGQKSISICITSQTFLKVKQILIFTSQPPSTPDINLAINICTYKREKFLSKTLNNLSEIYQEVDKSFIAYVIDNSNSLVPDKDYPFVKIIKQNGLGSTGGFTRGLLAAKKDGISTHVLFMDDDIKLEPQVIVKLINLLRNLNNKYKNFFIGGILLALHEPYLQVEAGGSWKNGKVRGVCPNLDLSNPNNLLKNTNNANVDYQGWWFSCVPLNSNLHLPLPLYFHREDVEYGLRAKGHIYFNGIGVWHNEFDNKPNSKSIYYDFRNMLILESIRNQNLTFIRILFRYLSTLLSFSIRQRPKDLILLRLALEDFSKGSSYITEIDGFNHDCLLGNLGIELLPLQCPLKVTINKTKSKNNAIGKLLTIISYFFCKNGQVRSYSSFNPNLSDLRSAEQITYYSIYAGVQYRSKRNRIMTIRDILEATCFAFSLRDEIKNSIIDWRSNYSYLTSSEYWERKFKETK